MMRKGLGKGMGSGYRNILMAHDKRVHRDAGLGRKQPQRMPQFSGKWNKLKEVDDRLELYPKIPYGYKIKRRGYDVKVSRGGLSKGVWESEAVQGYLNQGHGIIGGWFGEQRNRWKDKILEDALRKQGLTDEGIGMWLTSTTGRHIGDSSIKTKEEWIKQVNSYTKTAKKDVDRWVKETYFDTKGDTQ
jgi:hypothetical protein